MSELTKME